MRYSTAITHDPENTSDEPFDVIVVELKGRGGGAKPAANPAAAKTMEKK